MVRKAAALILIRDQSDGIEVCMLRRVGSSRFAPGAYVFPGGGVEEQDESHNNTLAGAENNTAKIAAIRETFEEAGILVAATDSNILTESSRERLNKGDVSFQQLLYEYKINLNPDKVIFYDHWITPEGAPIRFDTRFFLAVVTTDQQVVHDDAETDASCWATPADLLEQYDRKDIKLMPVTHVQLKRLSLMSSVNNVLNMASRHQHITPTLPVLNFDENGKATSVTIELTEGVIEYSVFRQ